MVDTDHLLFGSDYPPAHTRTIDATIGQLRESLGEDANDHFEDISADSSHAPSPG